MKFITSAVKGHFLDTCRQRPAGNQFETCEFIPGATILGTLANKAAQRNDLSDAQIYTQFVSLFLRGGVNFPILYPAYHHQNSLYPTIPAPLGLLTCSVLPFSESGDGHKAFSANLCERCPRCNEEKLEPVRGFVILRRKGDSHVYSPNRSSELHIHIDEESGRVKEGQLYGYTVLDAGQYFVGELICASNEAWKHLQKMTGIAEKTPLQWRLGKARRRGYGKVTTWLKRCDEEAPLWIQLPLEQRITDPKQPISLTLLTDTIISNHWGQQAVSFSEKWLEDVLGLGAVQIKDTYARTRVVDSFNSHLGLPRWRDTALTAGSVVWFTLKNPPENWQKHMESLERGGIGLRCNEGFGRVAFNHPVYEQREKLTKSNIRLNSQMRLGDSPSEDTFVENWEEKLNALLPQKLNSHFITVARWLQTHSTQPPQTLAEDIKELGSPDKNLIKAIGGKREYGERSKDNFFQNDGRKSLQKICETLMSLAQEDANNHQRGVEQLADTIAALAHDEKGEP